VSICAVAVFRSISKPNFRQELKNILLYTTAWQQADEKLDERQGFVLVEFPPLGCIRSQLFTNFKFDNIIEAMREAGLRQ
jgi:hypothetical protein